MDASTPQRPETRKVNVVINGLTTKVPKDAANVYLVEAHLDEQSPATVTKSILTIDIMFAWTWLIEILANGGWGEVVAFDIVYKNAPRWSRNLGRIDGPTRHPNPLRHTRPEP
ncbi:hypothetical protein ABT294_11600 [Nonomuraea sp. NPDC000554]|uniref:hypothetical protein n=1 Tax=Nonomuraea sp. NPDC000554 TaxID=3154259 RepID=UPI00331A935D